MNPDPSLADRQSQPAPKPPEDSTLSVEDPTLTSAPSSPTQWEEWLVSFDQAVDEGRAPEEIDLSSLPDELRDDALGMVQLLGQLELLRGAAPAARDQADNRIGRFEIVRELGRGAHGLVFLAIDPRLEREVALKVPRTEVAISSELLRRFRLEAQAAASLDHRHIVAVYEVEDDGISCHIASAFCNGPTLASWLREHAPVEPHAAAALIADLADAVEHAHRRGVLHRDIKPGNVLLDPVGEGSGDQLADYTAKLTDFGLAKVAEHSSEDTRSGTLLGTPAYMAPEQAKGQLRSIGPATDVYALGVMLYELLCGTTPFRGQTDADTLRRVVSDEPERLRRLRPDISPDLEAICLRCLERQPLARYGSAGELKLDLERYLAGMPTEARPLRLPQRVQRWGQRNPSQAALVAVILLALAALSVGGWWSAGRLGEALQTAEQQRSEAQQQRDLAVASRAQALRSEQSAQERLVEAVSRAYSFDLRQAKEFWAGNHFAEARAALDRHVPSDGLPDMREFGWWFLHRQLDDESRILGRHGRKVGAVAVHPAGGIIATAGGDGVLCLWDLETRTKIDEITEHRGRELSAVCFSPDGSLLGIGAADGLISIWDLSTKKLLRGTRHGLGWLTSLVFSPDGKELVSAGADKKIQVWEVPSLKKLATMALHTDTVRGLVFYDQETLFSAGSDGQVRAWDMKSRAPDPRFEGGLLPRGEDPNENVYALTIEASGRYLAGALWEQGYQRWSLASDSFGELVDIVRNPPGGRSVASNAQGLLALGNAGGTIYLTEGGDTRGAPPLFLHHSPGGRVNAVAFEPKTNLLVAGSLDGAVRLYELPIDCLDGGLVIERASTLKWRRGLLFSQFFGARESIYDLQSGAGLKILNIPMGATDIAPSAGLLAGIAGTNEKQLLVVKDFRSGEVKWRTDIISEAGFHLEIDPGERWVVVTQKRDLRFYDLRTGEMLFACTHPAIVAEAEFIDDGAVVATTAHDGCLRLWDTADGKLLAEQPLHQGSAKQLRFTSDGSRFATGADGAIHIWDRQSWQKLATIPARGYINNIVLLDGGRTVAILFDDTLTLWRVADGAEVMNFRDDFPVQTIAASEDGQRLAIQFGQFIHILDGSPDSDYEPAPEDKEHAPADVAQR